MPRKGRRLGNFNTPTACKEVRRATVFNADLPFPVCRATCDHKASDPHAYSPLTSRAPAQTDTSANQVKMSFSTGKSTASSTAKVHLAVNVTPVPQANTPENHHVGASNKTHEDSTTTPHELKCAACNDQVSPENTWQAPCQHIYCIDCLERLFRLSMETRSSTRPDAASRSCPGVKCIDSFRGNW